MIFVVYSLEAMLRYLPDRNDMDLVLYNGLTNTETNFWFNLNTYSDSHWVVDYSGMIFTSGYCLYNDYNDIENWGRKVTHFN